MDFVTVLQILRRRWMLFGGAMLVTLATAAILSTLDLATYASEGTVVVVRGSGAAEADGVQGADPALQQTARILVEVASAEAGITDNGQVVVAVDENLPVLRVTATEAEGPAALDAVTTITEALSTQLDQLQENQDVFVPEGTSIRRLVPPTDPEAITAEGALEYTSTATLLLVRSEEGTVSDVGANGIIDPDNSENFVAGVIAERFTDDSIEQQMLEEGATGDITLEFDELNPIIRVLAESEDRDEALQTGQVAIDTLQRIARDIQAADDIPEDLRFRVEALSYPLNAEVFESARLRTVLAVVALGLLASIGLALMADAAEGRRLARAAASTPSGDGPRGGSTASEIPRWPRSGSDDTAGRDQPGVSRTNVPTDQ